MADCILAVDRLSMLSAIVAVNDLSFEAERRKITALIGPNARQDHGFNSSPASTSDLGAMRLTHESGKKSGSTLNDFRISSRPRWAYLSEHPLFPHDRAGKPDGRAAQRA